MSLIPDCKEVHRLTSEGLDRRLGRTERARMRLHLFVCQACRNFTNQMRLIRQAMRQILPASGDSDRKEQR